MAAANLARGHNIDSNSGFKLTEDDQAKLTYFMFAKEFHWTPDQVRSQNYSDIMDLQTIMSTYNRVVAAEQKRAAQPKSGNFMNQ